MRVGVASFGATALLAAALVGASTPALATDGSSAATTQPPIVPASPSISSASAAGVGDDENLPAVQGPTETGTLAPAVDVNFADLPDAGLAPASQSVALPERGSTQEATVVPRTLGVYSGPAPTVPAAALSDKSLSSDPAPATQPSVTVPTPAVTVAQQTNATLDSEFRGGADPAVTSPPDTQIAVSDAFVVEMLNNEMAVFNRNGGSVANPKLLADLFQAGVPFPGPNGKNFIWKNVTDPKVLYDPSTGRFFASEMVFDDHNEGSVKVAVSDTADPTGHWNISVANYTTNHLLMDQPKLAVSVDKVTIVDDLCHQTCDAGGQIIVLDKGELVNKRIVDRTIFKTSYGAAPAADPHSSQTLQYVYHYHNSHGSSYLQEQFVSGTPSTHDTKLNSPAGVAIAKTSSPPAARQPLPSRGAKAIAIDTGDDKVQSAVSQAGVVWISSGDGCKPAGDTKVRACLRLIELVLPVDSASPPTLAEDIDRARVGVDLFYPAVTVDAINDVIVSYSVSSPTMYASAEEVSTTEGGFIGAATPITYATGNATLTCTKCHNTVRFGDYSGAAPDPADVQSVWIAGEIGPTDAKASGNWNTEVAMLTFQTQIFPT